MGQALEVPFLVVREGAGLEAWARGQRALRVMLGVDRSRSFEVARDGVKALAKVGPLDVVGGHVFWVSADTERLGLNLVQPCNYRDVSADLREALEREVSTLLEPLRAEPPRVRAVLATTDFMAPGDRAVAYAFALTPPGGTVHLPHVEPDGATPRERQAARRQLELRVPRAEQDGKHKVELSVLTGG
ncbi:hypothetical protein [Myxococcus qinghaiensis]|uniref:hypothetical protein n=1 Tax=Myxococcus qinghaiensis TaxID=2906758 RepID=UPI0020A81E60|nr:hypothetical protein [Myxococcus qinghaiensis]MCP3164626.1 hypothetical protein [Myxococcus qinghaiensis]